MTDASVIEAAGRVEIRPRSNGDFDEIIARKPDTVHVETLSDTSVYIGFDWDDGEQLQFWINSAGNLTYHHGRIHPCVSQGLA